MKKIILLGMFIVLISSIRSYSQLPEHIYYKFSNPDSVINHAINPVGVNPTPINSPLIIDSPGFLNSDALSGASSYSLNGGVRSQWNTTINGSFTIGFWYNPNSPNGFKDPMGYDGAYLFGDSLLGMHCFKQGQLDPNIPMYYITFEFPDLFIGPKWMNQPDGQLLIPRPLGSQGAMIHIVYDAQAKTLKAYVDGVEEPNAHLSSTHLISNPNFIGSGLNLGNHYYLTMNGCSFFLTTVLSGLMDEFRWYDRALSEEEIADTYNIDLLAGGNCPPFSMFSIDSVSGNSAKISWVPGSSSNSFYIEYGTKGFTPGTGSIITGTYPGSQPPVILSNLSPQQEYEVYFGEICNSGQDSTFNNGPRTFVTTKLCSKPFNITASNATLNSVDLSWDHIGNPAQNFSILYGPKGFDPNTSGSVVTTSSSPYTLTGLNHSSQYDIYVIANCGPTNGLSDIAPAKAIAVNTLCDIAVAPFYENFDDAVWVPGALDFNQMDTLDHCWTRVPENTYAPDYRYTWAMGPHSAQYSNSQLSQDYSGNGNFIYILGENYDRPSSTRDTADLISPTIDISGLTAPYLSFYYFRAGNGLPDFVVEVNDGTGWQQVLRITGTQQQDTADPWLEAGVDLSSFSGTIDVRFRALGISRAEMAIDEIRVDEAPACPPVNFAYEIHQTGSTDSSVVVNISGPNQATTFNFEWGPVGYTQGTSSCIGSGTNTYTVDSCLLPNSAYDLFVQNDCSASNGQVAAWSGPYTIYTDCEPKQAPYVNIFSYDSIPWESPRENYLPNCWQGYYSGIGASMDKVGFVGTGRYTGFKPHNLLGKAVLQISNYRPEINDSVIAISPRFSDMPLASRQVRFMGSTDSNHVEIVVGSMSSPYHGSGFKPLDTLILNGQWDEYIVRIDASNGYNGVDEYVGLMTNNTSNVYIDNFYYEVIPACTPPHSTSLGVDSITRNSARISWAPGQGSKTIVEWGLPGFTPNMGNQIGKGRTTSASYVIENLSSGTVYEAYIRDSCNVGGLSPWRGPVAFFTKCVQVAPYFDDFDSWAGGSYTFYIDSCWEATTPFESPYWWQVGTQSQFNSGYGPSGDHTTGSDNYLFTYFNATPPGNGRGNPMGNPMGNASIGDTALLYMPYIDISPLSSPALSFYYHRFGGATPDKYIEVNDGSGWVQVAAFQGEEQTSYSAPYKEVYVDLSSFTDTIQVRFIAVYKGVGITAFDNLKIDEMPVCFLSSLNTTNVVDTAATFSWQGGSNNSSTQVWWGPPGFFQGTQAPSVGSLDTVTTSSYMVDTLSPGTCYEFWVRSVCTGGDTTLWTGPEKFCTPCKPVIAPYTQDFDAFPNGEIAMCWSHNENNTDYSWSAYSGLVPGSAFRLTGPLEDATSGTGSYLYVTSDINNNHGAPGDTASLYSPVINIDSLDSPHLKFSYHMFGGTISSLHADIFDGNTWHMDVVVLQGPQQNSSGSPWLDTLVNISGYTSGSLMQVRFRSEFNGTSGNSAIDDFSIINVQCPLASGIVSGSTGCDSLEISWSSDPGTTQSDIEYGPNGFTPGTGNIIRNVSSPYVVDGLLPSTAYDFYIVDSCAAGKSVAGPVKDTTLDGPLPFASFSDSVYFSSNSMELYLDASGSQGADSTSWDFGNGNTGNGTIVSETYTSNGTYQITLSVWNDCGRDDSTITINANIGLPEDQLSRSFKLFPNPTKDEVTISFDLESKGESSVYIALIDGTGRTVLNFDGRSDSNGQFEQPLDIASLADGVYMVEIRTDNGMITYKKLTIQ